MLKLHSLLMVLVLGISASAQAQEQDSFAVFEGKWRHTDLYCRSFNRPLS